MFIILVNYRVIFAPVMAFLVRSVAPEYGCEKMILNSQSRIDSNIDLLMLKTLYHRLKE